MADVVCVGAHPDDVEIGMGGTVAAMVSKGVEVVVVDLTDGEPTPYGTHDTRMAEADQAARVLGAQRRTLTLPNRYLFDDVDARTQLAGVLRELRPRLLFVPYPEDAHPDHVAAASIARAARFYAKLSKTDMPGEPHYPARVYHYMAVHMRLVREPTFVMDISETLGVKLDALACYRSQFEANERNHGVIPMMESAARMWGTQIGVTAGEPFFSAEPIGIRSVTDLV